MLTTKSCAFVFPLTETMNLSCDWLTVFHAIWFESKLYSIQAIEFPSRCSCTLTRTSWPWVLTFKLFCHFIFYKILESAHHTGRTTGLLYSCYCTSSPSYTLLSLTHLFLSVCFHFLPFASLTYFSCCPLCCSLTWLYTPFIYPSLLLSGEPEQRWGELNFYWCIYKSCYPADQVTLLFVFSGPHF